MTPAAILDVLKQRFGDKIKSSKLDGPDPYAVIDPADLLEVCRFLRDDSRLGFAFLNCISGVDYLELDPKKAPKAGFDPHLEVVYHFSSFRNKHRIILKVLLPRWKDDKVGELPEVPSLTPLYLTANWHEREVYDLCGIWFVGHPDPRRMLLAEDWVGHPLRNDKQQ
jgi:NADH-quinone oxidoreductase subunit C